MSTQDPADGRSATGPRAIRRPFPPHLSLSRPFLRQPFGRQPFPRHASTRILLLRRTAVQRHAAGRLMALGPAFVAAVAYVDPGNVATNVTAGVRHGYLLCWVVIAACVMAMLVQYLSAKLGLATGSTLPTLCRRRFPPVVALLLWAQAEAVALATELAEVLGGAIALQLLFGTPLALGAVITAIGSMVVLLLQGRRRQRRFEAVIAAILGVCGLGFVVSALRARPSGSELLAGVVPRLEGQGSLLIAAGILGATVMPHAIYLHSALVRDRFRLHGPPVGDADLARRTRLLHHGRTDILLALSLAAGVNLSLVVVAAASLRGVEGADTIQGAAHQVGAVLGPATALLFSVGLLASGLASSSVGAYAGAVVIEGFTGRRIAPLLRRSFTLMPVLAVIMSGVDLTQALVISQVVLSIGIPFALWPLIMFTRSQEVMGSMVNRRLTNVSVIVVAVVVTMLVVALGWQVLG